MLYGQEVIFKSEDPGEVLILIFLENALRLFNNSKESNNSDVLILIFLENALRPLVKTKQINMDRIVLILIFLENALRQKEFLLLSSQVNSS